MGRSEKIVCQCGGRLERPIPKKCPHCGKKILGVRTSLWHSIYPVLAIVAMFAVVAGFLWYAAKYLF